MNPKSLSLFLAVFFFCFQSVSCQIDLNRIARETERSVNKRVERGIEKSVDKTLDNAESQVKGKKKSKKNNKSDEAYDESGKVQIIKEVSPFTFSGNIMITVDGTGNISSNLIKVASQDYLFSVRPLMIKKPNNLMIYDKEEESLTKINTELYEDKALKDFYEYELYDESKTKTKLERTSDIKEIEGYIARKYIVEGDDYNGIIWLSSEVDMDYDLFSSIMEMKRLDIGSGLGFPLEMHISFDSGDTMDFTVNTIEAGNPDKALFDVSAYEMIDMTDLKSGN